MVEGLQRARWRHARTRVSTAAVAAAVFSGLWGCSLALSSQVSAQTLIDAAGAFIRGEPAGPRAADRAQERVTERAYDRAQERTPERSLARRAPSTSSVASGVGEKMNAGTVAIVSGGLSATYLTIASDLAAVLDDGDAFRVLPIVGKGGTQNIRDVRFLRGVDLGITQANLLGYLQRSNEIGRLDDKLAYVAKLFNEEMHVLVKQGSGISSLADLAGKKVNFSEQRSGTQFVARDVFARLGIAPVEVNLVQAEAIEKLETGEIAATVVVAGKPIPFLTRFTTQDGFRLLPIGFAKPLQADFLPAAISTEDYPGLVGAEVETVAVGTVLFAYNWPRGSDRYKRIATFVEQFFPRLAELQKSPRHPKWRETNLAAVVPGWTRFPAAEEWLARRAPTAGAPREEFEAFLSTRRTAGAGEVSPAERERLFQEFLRWNEARERR